MEPARQQWMIPIMRRAEPQSPARALGPRDRGGHSFTGEEFLQFGESSARILAALGAAEQDLGDCLNRVGQFGVSSTQRGVGTLSGGVCGPMGPDGFGNKGSAEHVEPLLGRKPGDIEQAANERA